MFFDYCDMLSGEPIFVDGVGHLRSPAVGDLRPYSGIGYSTYKTYLNFLAWDKEQLLQYVALMWHGKCEKLHNPQLATFDVATLFIQTREFYRGILSFFMLEDLVWDERRRCYLVIAHDGDRSNVGEINRSNFDQVRKMMLQLNFIGLNTDQVPESSYANDKAKEWWEKAQEHLKQNAAASTQKEDKPAYHLSNIISKVCTTHPSYNLINVFELTVFQLYDAFFQLGYMRSIALNERIFTNYGGETFNFDDWINPIVENV